MDHHTQALFEAHVQHELSRFNAKNSRLMIREEVAALFDLLRTSKLNDLLEPEQVSGIIARNVVKFPITQAVTAIAEDIGAQILKNAKTADITLQDIVPAETFHAMVRKVGSLKRARQEFIRRVVSSSVYSQQISEALFSGIKEYLLTENILAQKVPGLASLIKFGKFAVNKTMHPLELAVEKTVKAYIEANLGNTLKRSETSINEHFDAPYISELGEQIWTLLADDKLFEYLELVDADDINEFITIGVDFWTHFRTTPYFKAIYTHLTAQFFKKHGTQEIATIIGKFGFTEKHITSELQLLMPPLLAKLLSAGYLENRIRARLLNFYQSPRATKLLASLTASAPSKARRARPPKTT